MNVTIIEMYSFENDNIKTYTSKYTMYWFSIGLKLRPSFPILEYKDYKYTVKT